MTDFAYNGAIVQLDTIAVSGIYEIDAKGAAGGPAAHGAGGGLGAGVTGDIYLAAGTVLEIVVGGAGAGGPGFSGPTSGWIGGGGGGGSFVFTAGGGGTDVFFAVAGGGGGGGQASGGGNAPTGPTGGNGGGATAGEGGQGLGGIAGAPGAGASGGGGGFTGGGPGGGGGTAADPTFAGGTGYSAGGFGGGGGSGKFAGGGGGGWGGGGGGFFNAGGGGGGGSYLDGDFVGASEVFTAGAESGNGDVMITMVSCFLAGTNIFTPRGEVLIEDLRAGDLVLTAAGPVLIRWIGVSSIATRFVDPARAFPIRIRAGALADGIPLRDLLVSPDHAMFLDGILVQAGALVNGTSITREDSMPARFTYYHVEAADHGLIFAEGALTETFVGNADRMNFDNWAEHEALYGAAPAIPELPYARAKSARQLPVELRQKLAARAGVRMVAA